MCSTARAVPHYGTGMTTAQALRRRPLTVADAPAVLALVAAYERDFCGEPMSDLEDILAEWQVPAFDLSRDTVGLWQGADLVATGELGPRGRLDLAVRAEERGRGLEIELLDELEDRARGRGLGAVSLALPEGDEVGAALLRQRGYGLKHTSWVLRLDEGAAVVNRQLPPGYQIRPFRPEDGPATFALISAAFGEWDSGPRRSFADWEAETLRRPGVETANFRLATCDDVVVGASVVFDGPDEAWVSQLATHPDHRGRGLAQQMLAETYAAARRRGLPHGGLSTDSRTGALDLYLRLGMQVRHTFHSWSLELGAADRA
jgi:mycothiol synthase